MKFEPLKKIVSLFVLAFVVLVCSSCDDLLSPEPLSQVTTGNFYQSEADIEQALNGTYASMKSWPNNIYLFMSEVRSNNYYEAFSEAQRDWADISSFNVQSQSNTINDVWGNLYAMVNRSNSILESIDGISFEDESLKARYRAEARFLRAMAYFQLVRLYGRVPLVTSSLTPEEGTQIGQSEPAEVYDFIVSEMEAVAEQLPNSYPGSEVGRITQWGAKGLLARVYLWRVGASVGDESSNLDKARSHLEDVINEEGGDVTFAESYEELFALENEGQYFLTEIQFVSGGSGAGTPLPSYVVPNDLSIARAPYGTLVYASRLALSPDLLESYAPQDRRFDVTIDTAYVPDPTSEVPDPDTSYTPFYDKFLPSEEDVQAGLGLTDRYDWPVNFPVLRYSDVLLMYAEVLVEQAGAPTSEAVSILNRIRERAGLDAITPSSKNEWEAALQRERRHEFAAEGRYWFFLVRTNQAVSTMNEWLEETEQGITIDEGKLVYPIPQSEIDIYPDLYQQNPGYL